MHHSHRIALFACALLVSLLFAGALVFAMGNADPLSPQQAIAAAFAAARQQPSFHMVADTQQTLMPKAGRSTVGKGDQTNAMRILGDVAQGQGTGDSQPMETGGPRPLAVLCR